MVETRVAALGPLNTPTTAKAAYMATSPLHYWPLDETSGTTAADLVVSGNLPGTCVGMTMGVNGIAPTDVPQAPPGIGGISPWFNAGSEHIAMTGKVLGGLNSWSIAAWILPAPDTVERPWYGEGVPSGNDLLTASLVGGNPAYPSIRYGNDSQAQAQTVTSSGIYIAGSWTFMVITRNGANLEIWWNLGRKQAYNTFRTNNSWTDASPATWLGGAPRSFTNSGGFRGFISHLAVWNRVLDKEADMRPIYEACTPLARTQLTTEVFTRSNSIWKQRVDDPADPPPVTTGSAATATKLVNMFATYSGGANASTGPVWVADASTPRGRMRIAGGQANIAQNPVDLWTALGHVPLPTGFAVPLVSDRQGQVYATDTKELWEFIQAEQTLSPPDPMSATPTAGGTLPQGQYVYGIAGELANGSWGQWSFSPALTLNGSQAMNLVWHEVEGADHYAIYRADPDPVTKLAVLPWRRITTRPVGSLSYLDNLPHGTDDLSSVTAGHATAVTTDWGCSYGGYMANCDTSVGHYPPEHANWGASASGMPLLAGSITIAEMQAGVVNHALYIGLPLTDVTGRVYPAQRNDGTTDSSNGIQEGTRIMLPASYDPSGLPKWEKMVAIALQKYGGYVRDTTHEVSIYIEDEFMLGRDFYPDLFEGRYAFELFDNVNFPWSQIQVIDPAWTLSHTIPAPNDPTPKLATLTDDFAAGTAVDPTKWPTNAASTILNQQARIAVTPSYSGGLSSSPHIYDVSDSSIYFQVLQVPNNDPSSEAGFTLINRSVTDCYIEMVYTDNGLLVCGYNSSGGVRTRVAQPTYNPTSHAWWRIRVTSGIVYWETSLAGTIWSTLGSVAWSATGWTADKLTAMFAKFYGGNFGSHSGNPDFVIDNINRPPDGPPPEDIISPIMKISVLVRDLKDPHALQSIFLDAREVFPGITVRDPNTNRTST